VYARSGQRPRVLTRRAAAAEELHEARKVKEAIIHPDTGAHARPSRVAFR
jgi:hypothetical protein